MAATNRCPRGSEGGDAVSDTPRTDKATCYITDIFGTQFETTNPAITRQLERELAAVTSERDVLRADLCAFAVDMERELYAVTSERDSMVARFRDEINQRQETQRANAIVDAAILSASQQEAQRLREALDAIKATARVAFCATSSPVMADTLAGIGKRCYAALSSTPAPVQVCKCTLRGSLIGDGCEVCNPELAKELARK